MGILVIIFTSILLLNLKTLYTADDYIYRFVYHTPGVSEHMEKITTGMIPYSMWNHYLNWNGRFVAHSIVQFFMQFDSKLPFDIFNSLIYLVLLLMMNRLSVKLSNRTTKVFLIPLIFLFTWFFIPYFGQSVLWVSGSGNYLWMSIIYLGFILFNLRNGKTNWQSILAAMILGFLTGASNENSGPAAVLIVILLMIKRFVEKKRINWNSVIGVLFSGVGFVIMMLAPGNRLRGGVQRSIGKVIMDLFEIIYLSLQQFYLIYILLLILLVIGMYYSKVEKATLINSSIFLIGHFASILVMALAPEHPERTFFGGAIFLGISLFILVYGLFSEMKVGLTILTVPLLALFLFSFWNAYQDIDLSYRQVAEQYQIIEHSEEPNITVMTPAKSKYNAYDGTVGLTTQPTAWMNVWEAKFFNVNSISGHYAK